MSRRRNIRYCKVINVLPAENVKEILVNDSLNAVHVKEYVKGCSFDIRKNDDDNTSLIQKDIERVHSLLEKVLYLSAISIIISTLTLCIC